MGNFNVKKWTQTRLALLREGDSIRNDESTEYNLSNGKILKIIEKNIDGMAGEPVTIIVLTVDDRVVKFSEIRNLLNSNDASELQQYLNMTADSNAVSAMQWNR